MKKWYLVMVVAVLPLITLAQKKTTQSAAIWPELQLNYGVGESGMLFLQNQYRLNTDEGLNQGPFDTFQRVELALGYEQTLTEHWRGGALARYAFESNLKQYFYTLFLRHNGNIKSLYFNKQVMFEYIGRNYVIQDQKDFAGRFRVLAELGRRIAVKNSYVTPAISYELFLNKEFGEEVPGAAAARTIDRTRLRIGLTYEITEMLRVTPYFLLQTEYYNVLAKYDENNNLKEEAHQANTRYPVIGIELKYNFGTPANTASITY